MADLKPKRGNRDLIEELKRNFELLDIEPKIPILEKEIENSDVRARFVFETEYNGNNFKIINKSYYIFPGNNEDIDSENNRGLSLGLPIHEIRHRIQSENENERKKDAKNLELFSIAIINNIEDEHFKKILAHMIYDMPDDAKTDIHEFDARIVEMLICTLMEGKFIEVKEASKLLQAGAPEIIECLLKLKKARIK